MDSSVRRGFRLFWTWKSRHRTGRPTVAPETRGSIREMSMASPRWGAPRIHGELQKLGISVSQATVVKYMRRPMIRNSRASSAIPTSGRPATSR